MKQKIYVRDGRRFVEVVDPLLRVGCYIDNLGRFLNYRTVGCIGRCIGIKDGYYIIAFFDRDVKCTYSDRNFVLYQTISRCISDNSELYKNRYIPEIYELLWAAHEYPELFNKNKDYLSNSLFYNRVSGISFVRGLFFLSAYQGWDSGYGIFDFSKLELKPFSKIKVYGKED